MIRRRQTVLTLLIAMMFCGPGTSRATTGSTWSGFMGDGHHTGQATLSLPGTLPDLQWQFRPDEHIWSYEHGAGPWSASAAICSLPERSLVIFGSYDHNVYALDASSGREVWRFATGGRIDAAPAIVEREGPPLVIVVAGDRTLYALDATSGAVVWSHEVYPWSLTVPPAEAGSPCAVRCNGEWLVLCSIWINDHRPFANVQKGELLAFEGATGRIRWRQVLSSSPLTSPAVGRVQDRLLTFVAAEDGRIHALAAQTGEEVWSYGASAPIHSSCTVGAARVAFGDDFGMLTCLDAASGQAVWTYKAGHAIHATPALLEVSGRQFWIVGSFDRRIQAVDVLTGRAAWFFTAGDIIRSSALVTSVADKPVVAVYAMDRNLYLLDGASGNKLGSFATGGYLWPLYTRGESIGSSPCAVEVAGTPLLILPGDDGVVYGLAWQTRSGPENHPQ